MPRELVDLDAVLVHETEKAYLLDVGGPEKVWVPKSVAEDNEDGTFTVPYRWAYERGLV